MRNYVLAMFSVLMVSGYLPAQSHQAVSGQIDGATHPEAIPNREAYLMLFLRFSDGVHASPQSHRVATMRAAGLSESEAIVLIETANSFRVQYEAFHSRIRQVRAINSSRPFPPEAISAFDAIAQEGWKAVQDARTSIQKRLGPEAGSKLSSFIDTEIKPRMTVVPGK